MRTRRSPLAWRPVAAVCAVALVLPACTGDDAGEASQSPVAATPSATYQKGEYRQEAVRDLCRAISARTLRLLDAKAPAIDADDGQCTWTDERGGVDRSLAVGYRAHEPPATRREYSATDEAEYRFRRPNGWEGQRTSPVRGLGDEARLARDLSPTSRHGAVWLVARQRNVVVDVRVEARADVPTAHGRVPTYEVLEQAALSAMRDLLGELTGKPVPARTLPAGENGDVTEVGDVCRAVRSAGRLTPGARRSDTSRRDSPRSGGCAWSGGDEEPELVVEVDALPPSPLDGATGTRVAEQLVFDISGKELDRPGLGDEAKVDGFGYDSGRSRTVEVYVREGNLLVSVEYSRWDHPAKEQLEDDAVAVARDVVEAHR